MRVEIPFSEVKEEIRQALKDHLWSRQNFLVDVDRIEMREVSLQSNVVVLEISNAEEKTKPETRSLLPN